jgi:hypothetical protein
VKWAKWDWSRSLEEAAMEATNMSHTNMNQWLRASLSLLVLTGAAIAGPPLICQTYSIGDERSLPWGVDKNSWNNPDPNYDMTKLVGDTLKLLESSKPLLARMETLRRAAVYSSKNSAAGLELAHRLTARALASELQAENNSLPLFDAGYFIESMKQMSLISKSTAYSGMDGYDWVKRSVAGLDENLTVEYAMGLMQGTWPNEHIRRAVAGVPEGSLLAQNLMKHFQEQSLAEVKRTLAITSASR